MHAPELGQVSAIAIYARGAKRVLEVSVEVELGQFLGGEIVRPDVPVGARDDRVRRDVRPKLDEVQVFVEHLNATVAAIRDKHARR
jgi:hypothetical protein